jgi:8-oxo-dGTP pyrophosphatase MutT (NUDIX family)
LKKNDFIQALKARYHKGLPGKDTQLKVAHGARLDFGRDLTAPENAKLSAVLLCLYPKQSSDIKSSTEHLKENTPPAYHIALIERVSRSNDRHGGQISFPGGKLESNDASLFDCALREANEEIGLDLTKVHRIGQLTDLYIPVSGFHVTPFLVYLDETPIWKRQPTEVQNILEPSLDHLLNPDTLKIKDTWIAEHITLNYVPYYDVEGKKVWGATAMILAELLDMVSDSGLNW